MRAASSSVPPWRTRARDRLRAGAQGGKLPGPTIERSYDLEYGSAACAIQVGAISAGQRAFVVDDVLATGGTAEAACRLVEEVGAEVAGIGIVLELAGLGGRPRLAEWDLETLALPDRAIVERSELDRPNDAGVSGANSVPGSQRPSGRRSTGRSSSAASLIVRTTLA